MAAAAGTAGACVKPSAAPRTPPSSSKPSTSTTTQRSLRLRLPGRDLAHPGRPVLGPDRSSGPGHRHATAAAGGGPRLEGGTEGQEAHGHRPRRQECRGRQPASECQGRAHACPGVLPRHTQWAAEEPTRWGPWVVPCPISDDEIHTAKERKRRKAPMDQRTRERLSVLPILTSTAARPPTCFRWHGTPSTRAPGQQTVGPSLSRCIPRPAHATSALTSIPGWWGPTRVTTRPS